MKNSASWFSIAAQDFDRAKKFYEALYDSELRVENDDINDEKMLILPADMENGGAGGAITQGPTRKPSIEGVLVYLDFPNELQEVLDRVEKAGGKIVKPKTMMGEYGHYALINDSEGNLVGLYSPVK